MRDGVKKEITPRGDGNGIQYENIINYRISKKRANPERGRKLLSRFFISTCFLVKKEITPRGDGNE